MDGEHESFPLSRRGLLVAAATSALAPYLPALDLERLSPRAREGSIPGRKLIEVVGWELEFENQYEDIGAAGLRPERYLVQQAWYVRLNVWAHRSARLADRGLASLGKRGNVRLERGATEFSGLALLAGLTEQPQPRPDVPEREAYDWSLVQFEFTGCDAPQYVAAGPLVPAAADLEFERIWLYEEREARRRHLAGRLAPTEPYPALTG